MKKNALLKVTSISNKSIYQLMLCGCFIAWECQYVNLRVQLLFFSINVHGKFSSLLETNTAI